SRRVAVSVRRQPRYRRRAMTDPMPWGAQPPDPATLRPPLAELPRRTAQHAHGHPVMGQPPAIGSTPAGPASGRAAVGAAPVAGRAIPDPREPGEKAFPTQTYGQPLAYPEQPRADAAWPAITGTPPRRRWRGIGVALVVVAALLLIAGVGAAWVL